MVAYMYVYVVQVCTYYNMYVHTINTYMTYIHDIHDITYMTCVYAGTRYPSIYTLYRTLPPTGAHYFKRYKKNMNLYYLPLLYL